MPLKVPVRLRDIDARLVLNILEVSQDLPMIHLGFIAYQVPYICAKQPVLQFLSFVQAVLGDYTVVVAGSIDGAVSADQVQEALECVQGADQEDDFIQVHPMDFGSIRSYNQCGPLSTRNI